jgi:hypothetical protein
MNTAMARRLALSDRVVWLGKDGYRPTGPGTITRITVHEVEVRWDCGAMTRYRRAHLHNLRHISDGDKLPLHHVMPALPKMDRRETAASINLTM